MWINPRAETWRSQAFHHGVCCAKSGKDDSRPGGTTVSLAPHSQRILKSRATRPSLAIANPATPNTEYLRQHRRGPGIFLFAEIPDSFRAQKRPGKSQACAAFVAALALMPPGPRRRTNLSAADCFCRRRNPRIVFVGSIFPNATATRRKRQFSSWRSQTAFR